MSSKIDRSKIELVIFDFDGTLADSGAWFTSIFNEIALRFGFPTLSTGELHDLRGHSNREIVRRMKIPLWKMPFIARYMRKRVALEAAAIPLFPDAGTLLQRLHRTGAKIAVVSSNSEANIRRILGTQNTQLISHFGCGAGLFGKARLLRSAIKCNEAQPVTTLCVGDETRDIEAARNVGALAAAVTWGYATPEVLRNWKPDIVFDTMLDIANYVERSRY